MRKLFLCLCFMFMAHICEASITVASFTTADDVTIAHLESFRTTVVNAINSADGGLLTPASVTSAKLDANTNPENRWNEAFNDFVYTGLTIPTSTDLTSTTASGRAYIEGVRIVKDATSKTYTASKHTYVDLSKTGTYTYSEVAIDASAPAVASNSIRLARVSTDSTKVASVRDDRVTTITLGTGSVTVLADADADTKIQVEESSDEDKIRFDTGGTERAIIDSNGLFFNGNVGIGKTNSSAKLDIRSSGTGTGFALRIADTTPTDRLVVLDNGNVGIGLTNPSVKLQISGNLIAGTGTFDAVAVTSTTKVTNLNADTVDGAGSNNSVSGVFMPPGALFFMVTGSCPAGTTDVTATYSNKFVRINATGGSTGGADTDSITLVTANMPVHNHTVGIWGQGASADSGNITGQATTNETAEATSSTGSGTAFTVDTVPAFVTAKACQVD